MKCRCCGHSGERKTLYRTRRGAVTVALRRGWIPTTYRCPTSTGWHLTSRPHGSRKDSQ